MTRAQTRRPAAGDDIDTVTDAVLTASRLLVALSARSIAAVNDSITLPQFRVMIVIHNGGPMKLTSIADALAVNPSTATRMVDRLVSAGLVSREHNPESRRELIVDLTSEGRAQVRDVTRRRRAMIRQIVRRMEPATRSGMVSALSAFAVAGGEPAIGEDRPGTLWF